MSEARTMMADAEADARRRAAQGEARLAALFERRDVRIALASHDMAAVFRLLQRTGHSQRLIAVLTGMTQSEVSDILRGRRQVQSYVVWLRVANGLGIPHGWVGLDFDAETAELVQRSTLPAGVEGRRVGGRW